MLTASSTVSGSLLRVEMTHPQHGRIAVYSGQAARAAAWSPGENVTGGFGNFEYFDCAAAVRAAKALGLRRVRRN